MNSSDKMRCHKVRRVLRYLTPNKHHYREKYARHLLLLFYPFRLENELFGGTSEDGVTEIFRNNRYKFEPYAELVDKQDVYGQIEKDETVTASYNEDPTEIEDSQNSSANLYSVSLMPKIPPDNESEWSIRSLNEKQRMVFNAVHKWSRNLIKSLSTKRSFPVDPIRIFLSGSGGTGKSHLIKTIYQVVSKELLYHAKDPEKLRVLLLDPTGISAVNIGGTTIHSDLGIKPGPKWFGLSDKMKASLRNTLSEVRMVLIDELLMVSSDLFYQDARLLEIFLCTVSVAFSGIAVVLLGDFL